MELKPEDIADQYLNPEEGIAHQYKEDIADQCSDQYPKDQK